MANKALMEITPEVLGEMDDDNQQLAVEFALKEIADYITLLQKASTNIFSLKRYEAPPTVKQSFMILGMRGMSSYVRGVELVIGSLEEMANAPFFNLVMSIPVSIALVLLL